MGSGIAVGYGALSHDLALGGNLARELSARTGRGATVDIIGDSFSPPAEVWRRLDNLDLARFDAIVFTLGGLEGLYLMPARRWRRQLDKLLAQLHSAAPARLAIVLVESGVPLLGGTPRFSRARLRRHSAIINAEMREACARFTNTTFVEFNPPEGDITMVKGRSTYRDWAQLIAPELARVLDMVGRAAQPIELDEELRQRALDALGIDDQPNAELEDIVESARNLFGASGASVTIIDHDMQHTKAAVGMPRDPIPRAASICSQTIERAEVFVVEDTTTDPRLAGSGWADGENVRFYAGYPVESPDGHRIGALCIVDTSPRTFSPTDAALLRQLALRVQSALWSRRVTP
ncbi:MAG: GAF domain-containing protein [Salinibacterium sp.]|nr:GAF domain-containing protein [Salinibacterium sp.]